ncbi:hypothetical protein [Flavobacterium sp.]|uniref:hypothetical protein n=1 Tax=Flavobacterium sp. TaxID=239 RepID=UPI0032644B91
MYKTDGALRQIEVGEILARGTILRHIDSNGLQSPFSDMFVAGFDGETNEYELIRPYVRETEKGHAALHHETFKAPASRLTGFYQVVLTASGKPYMMSWHSR